MSNFKKFHTLYFFYAASFAVVIQAVPKYYPGLIYDHDYHHHGHHDHHLLQSEIPGDYRSQEFIPRRFIREPQFDGYKIGDSLTDEKFYEPIYENQRRTRSDVTSRSNSVFVEVEPDNQDLYENVNPDPDTIYGKSAMPIVRHRPQTINKLYVVRSADPINLNSEDNLFTDKKSAQKFNPFPISMMRQDSTLVNTARSFTDEELGRIVRKAITTARYGDSEKADSPSTKRFSQSIIGKPLEDSKLQIYRPRISSINYPTDFIPEINMADITSAGEEDETVDRLSTDFKIEKGFSIDNDDVTTIGEDLNNVQVHPDHIADVALSDTEPEVYQFVDEVERSPEEFNGNNYEEGGDNNDDPIEGDVVLSVIEEDITDQKNFEEKVKKDEDKQQTVDDNGTDSLTTFITETPTSTTDNYDTEKDLNPAEDGADERPPTTTETSLADESITDRSTTNVE